MKTILVTGVSKGLGAVITNYLLEHKYQVIGLARTKTTFVENLLKQHEETFIFIPFDLSDANASESLLKTNSFKGIKIDAFINNAAIAYDDLITNAKLQPLIEMFNVNVISPVLICRQVIRNMLLHSTKGSIVHISSISVHTGYKGLSMYASTKGAIEAFSKNTSREWGEIGIRSNCIVAGFMETEMSNTLSDDQKKRIFARTALKKTTEPLSVAATVEFLINDKSGSITGQNIFVDSGVI
jgi:3-oxoacyl-[acyl-carrier protein] reductase